MSKNSRRDLIASRAAATTDATPEPTPAAEELSVAEVAREMGINPKVARAKLRRHNIRAKDGRHARVMRDTPAYAALVALLKPAPKADTTPAS